MHGKGSDNLLEEARANAAELSRLIKRVNQLMETQGRVEFCREGRLLTPPKKTPKKKKKKKKNQKNKPPSQRVETPKAKRKGVGPRQVEGKGPNLRRSMFCQNRGEGEMFSWTTRGTRKGGKKRNEGTPRGQCPEDERVPWKIFYH